MIAKTDSPHAKTYKSILQWGLLPMYWQNYWRFTLCIFACRGGRDLISRNRPHLNAGVILVRSSPDNHQSGSPQSGEQDCSLLLAIASPEGSTTCHQSCVAARRGPVAGRNHVATSSATIKTPGNRHDFIGDTVGKVATQLHRPATTLSALVDMLWPATMVWHELSASQRRNTTNSYVVFAVGGRKNTHHMPEGQRCLPLLPFINHGQRITNSIKQQSTYERNYSGM